MICSYKHVGGWKQGGAAPRALRPPFMLPLEIPVLKLSSDQGKDGVDTRLLPKTSEDRFEAFDLLLDGTETEELVSMSAYGSTLADSASYPRLMSPSQSGKQKAY